MTYRRKRDRCLYLVLHTTPAVGVVLLPEPTRKEGVTPCWRRPPRSARLVEGRAPAVDAPAELRDVALAVERA